MGFEPFIIPKRDPEKTAGPVGSRDDRVMALARLLHSRGLTSSMTDAKRLAEGMVDVERKVVKQESAQVAEKTKPVVRSDIADTKAHEQQKSTFNLSLQPDFAQFVAKAATLHEPVPGTPAPQQTTSRSAQMSYGREEQKPISEVPHVKRQSQQFYDEAPDWTKLRGYKGPAPKSTEYPSQKLDFAKVRDAAMQQMEQAKPASSQPVEQVVRVETSDGAVKVTKAESSLGVEVVQETMVIEDTPEQKSGPSATPIPSSESEKKPAQKPQESIDLFDFFKKKG